MKMYLVGFMVLVGASTSYASACTDAIATLKRLKQESIEDTQMHVTNYQAVGVGYGRVAQIYQTCVSGCTVKQFAATEMQSLSHQAYAEVPRIQQLGHETQADLAQVMSKVLLCAAGK